MRELDIQGADKVRLTVHTNLVNCAHTNSLHSELSRVKGNTVDKLYSTPDPVEFLTFVNIHDTIGREGAGPHGVTEVGLDSPHHSLKQSQSNTQPFLC